MGNVTPFLIQQWYFHCYIYWISQTSSISISPNGTTNIEPTTKRKILELLPRLHPQLVQKLHLHVCLSTLSMLRLLPQTHWLKALCIHFPFRPGEIQTTMVPTSGRGKSERLFPVRSVALLSSQSFGNSWVISTSEERQLATFLIERVLEEIGQVTLYNCPHLDGIWLKIMTYTEMKPSASWGTSEPRKRCLKTVRDAADGGAQAFEILASTHRSSAIYF